MTATLPANLLTARDRRIGTTFVALAVLFQAFWLGLPASFLSIALVASYLLWSTTDWRIGARLPAVFALALTVFVAHASEEFATGFQVELPAMFDREWTNARFLVFNGVWATLFVAAGFHLRNRSTLAVLIVVFFALAGGIGNGILHLALVIQRGAYFPGAWTAPFCLVMGVWLFAQLYGTADLKP